jgi:hypothetical protein
LAQGAIENKTSARHELDAILDEGKRYARLLGQVVDTLAVLNVDHALAADPAALAALRQSERGRAIEIERTLRSLEALEAVKRITEEERRVAYQTRLVEDAADQMTRLTKAYLIIRLTHPR